MSGNNDTVYLVNGSTLTNIANAIRTKTGKSGSLYPSEMDEEITSISTGIIPTGNINISTNGSHDVTNYSTATVNIDTESHPPITVNITQSEHQTITVIPSRSFGSKTSSGTYSVPNRLILNASIEADSGYIAGELNESLVEAYWGDTVTFSATPATEVPIVTITFKKATDSAELTNNASNYSVTLTYTDETGEDVNSDLDLIELNTNDININVYYDTSMHIYITKGINFIRNNKQVGISYSDEPSDNEGSMTVGCDSNKTLYVYASST